MRWWPALARALGACVATDSPNRFERWLAAGHAGRAGVYESHLRSHGVADVVPMAQLLRSGRRWRACGVDEFAVPPAAAWPDMVATLEVVRDLKASAVLPDPVAVSGWRSEAFNRCEGGSARSRHLRNAALDLDANLTTAQAARLCRYWRERGRRLRFGLGFYSPTRIHVDTGGFRTWGPDYRRGSSRCLEPSR